MPYKIIVVLLLIAVNSFAQKDYKIIKKDWSASWIGESTPSLPNTWTCFRKEIELTDVPQSLITNISTDSKYWLWINEKLVVFEGQLKRGPTPNDTYFDAVEIAPHLRKGKNTIAILVWYWGKEGFCHKSSGKSGLLFEAKTANQLIISDNTWKISQHLAYGNSFAPFPNFRLPEHNVRYDARVGNEVWIKENFEDTQWKNAEILAKAGEKPWGELWKRPFKNWFDSGLIEYKSTVLEGTKDDKITMKLPRNLTITPYFKIEAPVGLLIDIRTDNYYGGSEPNVRTEYITKAGIQEFETPAVMNGHEVIYSFPEGVKVLKLKYRETRFDANFVGKFTSNDPFWGKLWNKSLYTMNVNMRDGIQDPDRERAQWWGDAVIILEEIFYSSDVPTQAAIRKSISNLLEWQKPDGVLFSPIPAGNWDKELPAQMLAAVGKYGIWKYYEHSGDKAFIKYAYPFVKKYMALWITDESGLVIHRIGGWDWHDWGDKIDVPVLDNAWYYLALESERNMAQLLGKTEESNALNQRMIKLKSAFNTAFWKTNVFKSNSYKFTMDDRSQGMAVVSGLADENQWKALKPALDTTFIAGPYLEKYILEAYFVMNDSEAGLARMKKRYQKMVDSELTTLWEGWNIGSVTYGGGSYNHGWSGGPLSLLSGYVSGIKPLTAGFERYQIKPQLGNLSEVKAKMQTVKGDIEVEIIKDNFQTGMIVKSGIDGNALIHVPKNNDNCSKLKLNGNTVLEKNKSRKLPEGIIKISNLTDYFLIETSGKIDWKIICE
jgi:alpha-L-rhamnosidase